MKRFGLLFGMALVLVAPAAAQPAPEVPAALAAIMAAGDGLSAETAYKVPDIQTEYAIMRQLGIAVRQQSLIVKGKPYDLLEGTAADGSTRQVWFDISSFYGKGF